MTGSNKILTVSYGTFSCTLEGFDDPFGTMRGIAEYFRDLAADDRYFGAEPPTPDVEMLQSIAQKEVNRRVEARVGETGLALRQVDEVADVSEVAEPVPADLTPAVEVEETPSNDTAEEAELAQNDTPAEPSDAETVAEDRNEEPAEIEEVLETGPLAFDDEYLMADEPEDVLTVDTSAAPVPSDTPVESVAEKLRRIRAVVSRSIEPEDPKSDFEPAPEFDAGAQPQRALSRTIAEITDDLSDEDDAEFEDVEDDDIVSEESDDFEPEQQSDDSLIAAIVADASKSEGDVEEENIFDEEEDSSETIADESGNEVVADEVEDDEDDFDAVLNAAIANVAALKDPAPQPETNEVDGEDTPQDATPAAEAEDGLIDEDFDAVDDPEGFDDADDFEDDEPEDIAIASETPEPRKTSKPLEPLSETNGNVGRLLQETDEKFNEDDGIRRRRVISQMRAAVAATKADRILSRIIPRDEQEAEDQNAYRQDLSRAMTRRPRFSEMAKAEEAARRPAPLVLVSSQRVDEIEPANDPEPASAEPEINVADTISPSPAEASNFREFAANMGATELPDLLEAAAAYTAFVEGQPHFSRPDIMKRVARVDPALEVSREAGLRSFGQLLRQGKIHKLQRGQFTVPESTRFNPTQRFAGE